MGSKYPFDDWLDGRVWLLRDRVDFTCMAVSMQSSLYNHARAAGVSVCTRVVFGTGVDGSVLVQAYPNDSTWRPNLVNIKETKIKQYIDNPR